MDAYPEQDTETNVVFNVHWTLTGDDGEGHTGHVYGSQSVSVDITDGFTPYEDLTETQVLGWVKDAMGEEQVAAHEANVAKQIDDQVNPPVVRPPLPWSA